MKSVCKCNGIFAQSVEAFNQQIVVDIPEHMLSYKEARLKDGLSDKLCIDPCIYNEILFLWNHGIITFGSCCGHNVNEPYVNVSEKDIDKMLAMGYIQNHEDRNRKDTFRLFNCEVPKI